MQITDIYEKCFEDKNAEEEIVFSLLIISGSSSLVNR